MLSLVLCALYLLSVCDNVSLVQTGLSAQIISLNKSWNDRSVLSPMLELITARPYLTDNRICLCALCLLQALLPVALSVMIARALSLGRWALIRIHPRIFAVRVAMAWSQRGIGAQGGATTDKWRLGASRVHFATLPNLVELKQVSTLTPECFLKPPCDFERMN